MICGRCVAYAYYNVRSQLQRSDIMNNYCRIAVGRTVRPVMFYDVQRYLLDSFICWNGKNVPGNLLGARDGAESFTLATRLWGLMLEPYYRVTRMHSADYAVARCPSVCHTPVFCLNGSIHPHFLHPHSPSFYLSIPNGMAILRRGPPNRGGSI